MTHSEAYLAAAKFGGFHTASFPNDYLLKHGNFFMKPTLHPDGFVYPAISEAARYRIFKDVKCESLDHPLDFAIKQEKPPTPPESPGEPPTTPSKSPTSDSVDSSTNIPPTLNGVKPQPATWIPGSQKLSWDDSTVASYNPDTKMFRCVVCNAVGFLSRIAEHYLGTHTSAKVFQCLHCPYSSTWSRCVRMHMAKHHGVPNAPPSLWKGQPLLEEIFQLLTSLKTRVDSQGRERPNDLQEVSDKKFVCPKCPYTTDRRDLYLRHENIHKEDKPYHCYVCFKLFNRADHVKKHFLRIHRGHPYDISLVRRRPPRISNTNGVNNNNKISGHSAKSNNFSVDKLIANNDKVPKIEIDVEDETTEEDVIIDLSSHTRRVDESATPEDTNSSKQLKTFHCPSCEWEGVDSWCLRRHMNTHQKGFECPLCDFRAAKAERLFTHVYRAHRKLVCTKCTFMTDMAQEFEVHIKECCVEITVSNGVTDKNSEDNSSDDAADFKFDPANNFSKFLSENGGKLFESMPKMDHKSPSVSLIPLHNSVSYCYPGAVNTHGFQDMSPNPGFIGATEGLKSLNGGFPPLNGKVNGFGGKLPNGFNGVMDFSKMNGEVKQPSCKKSKVEVKAELASPVQSSSDSGITEDVASGDIACFHCGCEFADTVSLDNHTELYHREEDLSSTSQVQSTQRKTKSTKKPRFSCALCNFVSDRQRAILEHMRFHTGEVLRCGVCDFTSVCDSTLEEHVAEKHSDGERRCPHCGFLCQQKVPFIRHYRKYHHSKSCSRCRVIKRSLDPKLQTTNEQLNLLLETSKTTGEAEVLPYLHHNPYSRRSNAIGPYSHCHSAMSKVAIAIAPSLQKTVEEELNLANENSTRFNKNPRKQTKPRKLLNSKSDKEPMPSKGKAKKRAKRRTTKAMKNIRQDLSQGKSFRKHLHQGESFATHLRQGKSFPKHLRQGRSLPKQRQIVTRSSQSNCRNMKKKKDSICDTITSTRNVKLLKVPPSRGRCCLMGHGTPIAFRSGASYIRHLFWCHHAKRFRCHLCSGRFRHEYQVLLHRRSVHENS